MAKQCTRSSDGFIPNPPTSKMLRSFYKAHMGHKGSLQEAQQWRKNHNPVPFGYVNK